MLPVCYECTKERGCHNDCPWPLIATAKAGVRGQMRGLTGEVGDMPAAPVSP
jgi:hypothetical protein